MIADPKECSDDPDIQRALIEFDANVRKDEAAGIRVRKDITLSVDDLYFRDFLMTAERIGVDVADTETLQQVFSCYRQLLNVELMTENE